MHERHRLVYVPKALYYKCEEFAKANVLGYIEGRKDTALAMHGAEHNIELQRQAKVAQYAVCIFRDLDPEKELDFSTDHLEPGHNFIYCGLRIKVCHTMIGTKLIYPKTKLHFVHEVAIDHMVLAMGVRWAI